MSEGRLQILEITVNGERRSLEVHPMKRLLDVLREDLGLTGTKEGCGEGECGACTVITDDHLILSCLTPICQADGKSITTIEGLAIGGVLDPVQEAFLESGGTQCGICTPGMILAAVYYLNHPEIAEDAKEALAGNQCRCTSYTGILEGLDKALEIIHDRGSYWLSTYQTSDLFQSVSHRLNEFTK